MNISSVSRLLNARAEEFCQTYLSAGKRVGQEWLVGDVSGSAGRSLAVQLEGEKKGLWCDRADATQKGDLLEILSIRLGNPIKASDEARKFLGLPAWTPEKNGNGHVHVEIFNPLKHGFSRKGDTARVYPKAAWPYHDENGTIFAYACRFEWPDGKKDVIPLRYIDGEWRWKGWSGPEKRPLYGIHKLKARSSDPVLIVEGEKTADAAQKLFPEFVCITWQGGCKAVEKADIDPILSRQTTIVLWPDADDTGHVAMTYLKARLPAAKRVTLPALPDGWDLADTPPPDVSPRGLLDAAVNPPTKADSKAPFRLLGFIDERYYYFSNESGTVVELNASEHNQSNLQRLCSDSYWEANYPSKQGGPDYNAAMKDLIARQHLVGLYSDEYVRGLGCWIDDGRIVYHAGDRLYVDGVQMPVSEFSGLFMYPKRHRELVGLDINNPATDLEAAQFLRLCASFNWKNPEASWMFPGWCMAAIVCGCLDWRPHAWLTGRAGSGKSWIFEMILKRILGICLQAQSSTTEAGIRQHLGPDARSVIFDEAEPKDEKSIARINSVLELQRGASSDSSGGIIKGSAGGVSRTYRIRSCFLFLSIAMGASEAADESRIARMELAPPIPGAFPEIKKLWADTVRKPEFCLKLQARAIRLAKVIRANAAIYQDAISIATGDSRTGQQYGAIAAGALALTSENVSTPAEAKAWCDTIDWDSMRPDAGGSDDDAGRCLEVLLQAKIEVQDSDARRFTYTIGELLKSWYKEVPGSKWQTAVYDTLMRHGIHPIDQCFDVANRHTALNKIFAGSHFASGWKDHLLRLTNAAYKCYEPPGGKTARCVRIPRDSVEGLK